MICNKIKDNKDNKNVTFILSLFWPGDETPSPQLREEKNAELFFSEDESGTWSIKQQKLKINIVNPILHLLLTWIGKSNTTWRGYPTKSYRARNYVSTVVCGDMNGKLNCWVNCCHWEMLNEPIKLSPKRWQPCQTMPN